MAIEKSDAPAPSTSDSGSSHTLSESVFSNPQDFLRTLRDNFSQLASKGQDEISKSDLQIYATSGADPTLRAAANIAANHFDELQSMPVSADSTNALFDPITGHSGIELSELDTDMKLESGDLTSTIRNKEIGEAFTTVTDAIMAAGSGYIGVAGAATLNPAFIIAGAVGAASYGTATFVDGKRMLDAAQSIREDSNNVQKTMAGWNEINS